MKLKLESIALVEEDNQFYLDAKYLKEENGITSEIHFPRIEIPFVRIDIDGDANPHPYGNVGVSCCHYDDLGRWISYPSEMCVNFGKGDLPLKKIELPTSNGREVFFTEQYLERDMTVKEIEEQLGHKIKIVDGE